MKAIFLILFLLISHLGASQSMVEIDSISNVMCSHLQKSDKSVADTLRVNNAINEVLYPFLAQVDQSKINSVGNRVFYRLQRNCVDFRNILDKMNPPVEGVNRKHTKPTSRLSKKELTDFKRTQIFKYLEVNGDETVVTIKGGYWQDRFLDGTYSKLALNWLNETEFVLTFIESNNESRSNFSVKGDKFIYTIISKEAKYYLMSVNIEGQQVYEEFKLYYE